jgi:Mg2+ and Co2+ transporter CorA
VSDKLKQRIHEYGRRDRRNAFFAERLIDLTERIEREFEGEERERLLAKARDAFDRHVQLRDQTHSVREVLARMREDQKRLLELCELISPRPEGELLH